MPSEKPEGSKFVVIRMAMRRVSREIFSFASIGGSAVASAADVKLKRKKTAQFYVVELDFSVTVKFFDDTPEVLSL